MIGEQAPEFQDIAGWINSKSLTLAELRGRVVFLDFWTFGCINCINTRPHFRSFYQHFAVNASFAMIGMHTPEFPYERNPENVRRAVLGHDLRYPIGLDSNNTTWKLYGNHYCPARLSSTAKARSAMNMWKRAITKRWKGRFQRF